MTTQQECSELPPRAMTGFSPLAQSLAALLFGLIVVLVVGFAPMQTTHDAAHDSRHGLAFPCH